MPSIVRISFIPVKKDATGEAGAQALEGAGTKEKFLSTAGLVKAYHGTPLDPNETPGIELIDVWSSLDKLNAYQGSPEAAEVRGALEKAGIIDTSDPKVVPYSNVFEFNEDFAAVAAASVVQFTVVLLSPDKSAEEFEAKWATAIQGWTPTDGYKGRVRGWSKELSEHPGLGKAQVFVVAVGWDSVESANSAEAALKEKFAHLSGDSLYHHVRLTALKEVK